MTLSQALWHYKYGRGCPRGINRGRWRGMLKHMDRYYHET